MLHQIPIGRLAKYGQVEVDSEAFPDHIQDHIWLYGIRQILNDACSDKKDGDGNPLTDAEVLLIAKDKYDRLLNGELRKRIESEPIDPVEREAFRMAKAAITTAFKKNGLWPTKGEDKFQQAVDARRLNLRMEPMTSEEFIAAWLEKNPKIVATAKKIVKERNELDLSEVGL